jgi:coenzyme F420-reducing hydrogenase beta subunit
MLITAKENCYGCFACMNICPAHAIEMVESMEGFFEPIVNDKKCVSCKLCVAICPRNNEIKLNEPQMVYAAWNVDRKIRIASSSGGIFLAFAKNIIESGGVVFGAMLDDTFDLFHSSTKKNDVNLFSGSKYFQSKIQSSFFEAKYFLDSGKKVLFSGTPCQIAGLNSYLRKQYDNLFTVDLICHGVTSRKLFMKQLHEKKYINDLKTVKFRDKTMNGWLESVRMVYNFHSKKMIDHHFYLDDFLSLYLGGNCFRQSCYSCQLSQKKRCSDITIGDFWGGQTQFKDEYEDGISVLLVNTKQGTTLCEYSKLDLKLFEQRIEDIVRGNASLDHPQSPGKRSEFFQEIDKHSMKYLAANFSFPKSQLFKMKIKFIFKEFLIKTLSKQRYKSMINIIKRQYF